MFDMWVGQQTKGSTLVQKTMPRKKKLILAFYKFNIIVIKIVTKLWFLIFKECNDNDDKQFQAKY